MSLSNQINGTSFALLGILLSLMVFVELSKYSAPSRTAEFAPLIQVDISYHLAEVRVLESAKARVFL